MAKVIGPSPTPPLCWQCRAAYINQHHINHQQGLCGTCWQRVINEQRRQRDIQEQSRRQQNSTPTHSVGHSTPQYPQPQYQQSQYSQPTQARGSDAENAAAGGCLVIVALFFLPYVGFNWLFRGSPFSMNQFIYCLDDLWAWIVSGIFWLFVIGLLNSKR